MSRIILIASGKGGTGKTTLAARLACAMCDAGRRVAAVDLDAGMGNLDIALGMHDAALFSISEVLSGAVSYENAAVPVHGRPNLCLLCAPPAGYVPPAEALAAFIAARRAEDTDIILDCGAGLGDALGAARAVADLGLVVTHAETACLRDAAATALFLSERGSLSLRLVCNRLPVRRPLQRRMAYHVDACMDEVGLPLGAILFEDRRLVRTLLGGGTAASRIPEEIRALAERIISRNF
ncbi:MAG: P-loop NTPase [Clostridia bacterium]|nr:P-loop NTPase [Clostridia bacterium]